MNSILVKPSSGDDFVTASSDGSCIIWDMALFTRRSSLFANTFFKAVVYHPDESQLVTAGLLLSILLMLIVRADYILCHTVKQTLQCVPV